MLVLIYRLLISLCFVIATQFSGLCYAKQEPSKVKKIGIVIPIEHQALREIAQGFQDALRTLYKGPIEYKISNAQGDTSLQHSIITQMKNADYDIIVPVSTSVTQMAAALIHEQPIIGLATDLRDKKSNLVIVNDEIDKKRIVAFIHQVYPELKKIALVHSTLDKIFSEAKQVEEASKQYNISLRRFMVQNLADLYSVSQAIPTDTQAIFILKDSLIASGIETLVQVAKKHKIALITSDDGTVQKGAGFAIGVHEKDIGVAGAKLAMQILQGALPNRLQDIKLTKPMVFLNLRALAEMSQDAEAVKLAAQNLHYPVEILEGGK